MIKTKSKLKSCLSIILAVCMIFNALPMSIFASLTAEALDKNGNNTINYVSLGASNVNGFGMEGYLPPEVIQDPENYGTKNVYGYLRAGTDSYPNLIKNYLTEQGYTTNLTQLAVSSMRAEELHVVLSNDYNGDAYTDWRFTENIGRQNWFGNMGGLASVRATYQNAIINADLITLDIGLNNFGVYLSNQIQNPNFATSDLNNIGPEYAEYFEQGKQYALSILQQYAPEYMSIATNENLQHVIDTVAYAIVGFCVHFDACVEIIRDLNPTATIVVVSIQNMVPGLYATNVAGVPAVLPMGDICGALTAAANTYTCALSPYADEYLYTDLRGTYGDHVDFFFNDLANYVPGKLDSVDSNQTLCFKYFDNDFRNAVKTTVQTVVSSLGSQYEGLAETIAYDVLLRIMQYGMRFNTLDMNAVFDNDVWDNSMDAFGAAIAAEVTKAVTLASQNGGDYSSYSLPENFAENIVTTYNVPMSAVETIFAAGIRFSVGNAFYGHPTKLGHQQIKASIVNTLEEGITSDDVVFAYIDKLISLVKKYGPEALDRAVDYADSLGYFDEAKEFKSALDVKLAEWNSDIDAIGDNAEAINAYCNTIASDIQELVAMFDAEATLEKVVSVIDEAIVIIADYQGRLENAIIELATQFGSDFIDDVLGYADQLGYFNDIEDFRNAAYMQADAWKAQLEAAKAEGIDALYFAAVQIANEMVGFAQSFNVGDKLEAFVTFINGAADIFLSTSGSLANSIADLIKVYGNEALDAIYNYMATTGLLSDAQAFKDAFYTKLGEWKLMIASAEGNGDAIADICNKIADDIVELGRALMLEEQLAFFAGAIKDFAATLEQYPELKEAIYSFIKAAGSGTAYMLYDYLVENGYIDPERIDIDEIIAQFHYWEAQLKNIDSIDPKDIADEIVDYLVDNNIITREEIDAVNEQINKLAELYEAYEGSTKEEIVTALAELIKVYGEDAYEKFYSFLSNEGYLDYIVCAENVHAMLLNEIEVWKNRYNALVDSINGITDEDIIALAVEIWDYLLSNGIIPSDIIETVEWYKNEIDRYIAYLEQTVKELIAGADKYGEAVNELIAEITAKINELKDFIDDAPEMIEAYFDELVENATHTEYSFTGDDYYLALGGRTAFGAGIGRDDSVYYELLAERLGLEAGQYKNSAINDYISDNLAYLGGLTDEIAKATLITYQQDADTFLFSAISGDSPDWTKYLSDEEIAYAERIIAKAVDMLPEDIDPETVEMIKQMIINFVYGDIEYAVGTVQGIQYINSINPDATVIIPSMYNPVRGLKLNIGGETVNIGKIFDYIVEATNVYYIVCANIFDNVTFVDVSEAETKGYNLTVIIDKTNYSELMSTIYDIVSGDGMYTTAAGHEYIAEQILGAIEIVGMVGDVNCDDTVDFADAALLYAYVQNKLQSGIISEQGFVNANVNNDINVDFADAALLYAFAQGKIAEFPM